MTTFDQELTGRYVFVRDTIRTLCNADNKFGIDPADGGSLAELVDAEEHLEHIANDGSQRPVMAPPTTGGDTA